MPDPFSFQNDPNPAQPQPLGSLGGPAQGGSQLGSLAQKARSNKLNTARNILYIVGVLFILSHGFLYLNASNEMDQEIEKEKRKLGPGMVFDQQRLAEFKASAVRIIQLIYLGALGLGIVFLAFGALVKSYPVPITILSLILFIGYQALISFIDPMNLVRGVLLKIIVVVVLVKAIQAAIAYQKEEEILQRSAESQGL